MTGKVGVELWEFATYPHHNQAHSRERLCASGFSTFHFRRATEEFAGVRIVQAYPGSLYDELRRSHEIGDTIATGRSRAAAQRTIIWPEPPAGQGQRTDLNSRL